jgi:hypothetical protein
MQDKKRATLPLLPSLVVALLDLRDSTSGVVDKGFHDREPMKATFSADLETAEIPFAGTLGRRVDFHALRKTFCTVMHRKGVRTRFLRSSAKSPYQIPHGGPHKKLTKWGFNLGCLSKCAVGLGIWMR